MVKIIIELLCLASPSQENSPALHFSLYSGHLLLPDCDEIVVCTPDLFSSINSTPPYPEPSNKPAYMTFTYTTLMILVHM